MNGICAASVLPFVFAAAGGAECAGYRCRPEHPRTRCTVAVSRLGGHIRHIRVCRALTRNRLVPAVWGSWRSRRLHIRYSPDHLPDWHRVRGLGRQRRGTPVAASRLSLLVRSGCHRPLGRDAGCAVGARRRPRRVAAAVLRQLRPMIVRAEIDRSGKGSSPSNSCCCISAFLLALLLPPTFLMGFGFPVLQRIVQTDFARLGRRIGILMVANIAGSVFGTIVTGLGGAECSRNGRHDAERSPLSALCSRSSRSRMVRSRQSRVGCGRDICVMGALVVLSPARRQFTLGALFTARPPTHDCRRGRSGLSVLRLEPGALQDRTTVFVNGVGQSTIPYGDIHTGLLAWCPRFCIPLRVTWRSSGLAPEIPFTASPAGPKSSASRASKSSRRRSTDCASSSGDSHTAVSRHCSSDPRINHVAGDGRIFLMRSPAAFDIIEADALRPTQRVLGQSVFGGIFHARAQPACAVEGLPPRGCRRRGCTTRSFGVFPHVVSAAGVLVGSSDPISDRSQRRSSGRLADPRVREHYARAGIDVKELMSSYLVDPAHYTPDFDRQRLTDFNTDLFPKDEYDLSPLPTVP